MSYAAIIVAAGRGSRAGGDIAKQWQEVAGLPVARWTVMRFAGAARRIVVAHPDETGLATDCLDGLDVQIVEGGATRALSVRAGLEALADQPPEKVLTWSS